MLRFGSDISFRDCFRSFRLQRVDDSRLNDLRRVHPHIHRLLWFCRALLSPWFNFDPASAEPDPVVENLDVRNQWSWRFVVIDRLGWLWICESDYMGPLCDRRKSSRRRLTIHLNPRADRAGRIHVHAHALWHLNVYLQPVPQRFPRHHKRAEVSGERAARPFEVSYMRRDNKSMLPGYGLYPHILGDQITNGRHG